jgi:hypothetical protein
MLDPPIEVKQRSCRRCQKYSGRVGTSRPPLNAYIGKEIAATVDDVRGHLWNDSSDAMVAWDESGSAKTILEQYKTCIEMADRVSARRATANTFFLSLNTAVFTAIGVIADLHPRTNKAFLIFPLIALLAECALWYWLLRSYRQLNSAKFAVIGAMEERLPASPFWSAEWYALGQGRDPRRYWPLTHIERWVPVLFAVAYVGAFIAAMAS